LKKVTFSVIGAVLGGVLSNFLFWGAGQLAILFDFRLYNSEDEASRNFLIFLIVFSLSVIGGAIYGFYLSKKVPPKNP